MAKKGTIKKETIESIKELLIQNPDGTYIQKTGDDYVFAFQKYVKDKFNKKSKNLGLFTKEQVEASPLYQDFSFAGIKDFNFFAKMKLQKLKIFNDGTYEKQKIIIDNLSESDERLYNNIKGILYMIVGVINGERHIVKFGQTRKTLKERIGSYNSGYINNLGTASTTNIFILQSLVSSNVDYEIYIVDCGDFIEQFRWYDITSKQFASSKSLAYENIILDEYIKQFGQKPLANTQVEIDDDSTE